MKKTITIVILFAFIATIIGEEIVMARDMRSQTYQLAVLNLVAGGDLSQEEANLFTKRLYRELNNQSIFNCLPLDVIENKLIQNELELSSCFEMECGLRIGQLLNVPLVTIGTLTKNGSNFAIAIILVDVAQGKAVQTVSDAYEGSEVGFLDYLATVAANLANISPSENISESKPQESRQPVTEYQPAAKETVQKEQLVAKAQPAKSKTQPPVEKQTIKKEGSGMKWLGVGILILGGVGAAYYLLGAKDKKKEDTNNNNNTPLPGPPTFP